MKTLIIMILSLVVASVNATTYLPIDLDQQLKESTGVIHAKHLSMNYKKDSQGNVVTKHVFEIIKSAGIKNTEIINKSDFSVIVPGGKWQGIVYKVHGAPTFSAGEEVMLLINKGADGFQLTNLALGKYRIERTIQGVFVRSSVFPNHRKLGKIDFMQFSQQVFDNFGEGFEQVYKDTYVYKPVAEKKNMRKPASIEKSAQAEKREDSFSIFWLILCLALLGVYSMTNLRGRSDNES